MEKQVNGDFIALLKTEQHFSLYMQRQYVRLYLYAFFGQGKTVAVLRHINVVGFENLYYGVAMNPGVAHILPYAAAAATK